MDCKVDKIWEIKQLNVLCPWVFEKLKIQSPNICSEYL